jgi:hypothetical protein
MELRWIDETEVERITGRKRQSLRNDRSMGRGFPWYKCGAKSVRYRLDEIIAQMEQYRREPRQTGGGK